VTLSDVTHADVLARSRSLTVGPGRVPELDGVGARRPAVTVTLEAGGTDTYTQRIIPGREPPDGPCQRPGPRHEPYCRTITTRPVSVIDYRVGIW
jgi:hypothetical protein